VLQVDIPETGLYALSVFGTGTGGQRWLADGCRSCLICPNLDPTARWRDVLTGIFPKGQHYFSATLGPDTVIERIRFEQKKNAPPDYLATVERLGLELGAAGPITRAKADEAREFLERRRAARERELCGDILRPGTLVAEVTAAGGPTGSAPGGGVPGGGGGGGGGTPPVGPPVIPPLPPGSPVTVVPASDTR
jgi:hypothetical protein